MIRRHLFFAFALFSLLFVAHTLCAAEQEDHPVEDAAKFKLQAKANPSLPTLFLVGDSTMKVGTPGQRGWGEEMATYFDPKKINVCNQAIGGRSSRTFQTEGRWAAVLAMVQKGDFVIIEFGHNDGSPVNEKPPITATTRARGTIKGIGEETEEVDNILTRKHEVVHSFGWYLRRYVADVKAAGATPILMSLIPRNNWQNGKVTRAAPNGHAEWARQVAAASGCLFIDHHEIIARAMEAIGQKKANALFADGKLHTSKTGAEFNARAAIAGLNALPANPLSRYYSAAARKVAPYNPRK